MVKDSTLAQFQVIQEEELAEVVGGGIFVTLGIPFVISYGTGYVVGYVTNRKKVCN